MGKLGGCRANNFSVYAHFILHRLPDTSKNEFYLGNVEIFTLELPSKIHNLRRFDIDLCYYSRPIN